MPRRLMSNGHDDATMTLPADVTRQSRNCFKTSRPD
jgi:hypothetical protein